MPSAWISGTLGPEWRELSEFQLRVAKHWLDESDRQQNSPCMEFLARFAALNALYWYWAKLDGIRGSDREQFVSLAGKVDGQDASSIVGDSGVAESIRYFSSRQPIRRMDRRTLPNLSGDSAEGTKYVRALLTSKDDRERVKALASLIYLVRCNLVHGSKELLGPDLEIVGQTLPFLRRLSTLALERSAQRTL